MDLAAIDQARLNFNPQGLFIINAAIGLMMLGVALELKLDDFKRIPDNRAVSIEVGIQNSGLGLVLVFNFFNGLGGMAILVAWWGIWHIIAGLVAAFVFSRRPLPAVYQPETERISS